MKDLYWYLFFYGSMLIGVSIWLAVKNTTEDFLIAGRDRKRWQIMSSKFANSVGASWFITYTGYTYLYGFSVLSILPGLLISFLFFAYWAVPKIYEDSREYQFYTQGDFVLLRTGSLLDKKMIDITGIVVNMVWLLVAVIGGAKVISFLDILSYEMSLFFTSGIILSYILLSGFKAVIVTDIIQTTIILILFGIIFYALFKNIQLIHVFKEQTDQMGIPTIVGFFIYGLFVNFSIADRYQLTFSAIDKREAKLGMALTIIPIVLMIFLLLVIGLSVHSQNANLDPDIVFIRLFFDYLPEMFIPIGALLFMAGLMSSVDSRVYNITSYIAFLDSKEGNKVQQIRVLTTGLIVLISALAYFIRDIVGASIFAAGVSLVPSIAMIYIIAGGKNSKRFLALIAGGIMGLIIGVAVVGLTPTVAIFPVLFSAFGFFVGAKRFRMKP